jgi:hypothetical protein
MNAGGRRLHLEKRFVRKDGSPITVNLNAKCDAGGQGGSHRSDDRILPSKKAETSLRQIKTYRFCSTTC